MLSPPGPPMALGNMRSLGVHSLAVECGLCHHEFVLPADHWSDAVLVREFSPRARCSGQEREESGAGAQRHLRTATVSYDGLTRRVL